MAKMDYSQIDVALSFLEEDEPIVLQVPYYDDIKEVLEYLVSKLGIYHLSDKDVYIFDKSKIIRIECINDDKAGLAQEYTFFIDRLEDDSYYENLEWVKPLREKYANIEFGILPKR